MSTRTLVVLGSLAAVAAVVLFPPQTAVHFAHATPVVELSNLVQTVPASADGSSLGATRSESNGALAPDGSVRRDFWTRGGSTYLLEVVAAQVSAAVTIQGRQSLATPALDESDSVTLVSEGVNDSAQRFVALLSGPKYEGSAIVALTNKESSEVVVESLSLRKVSKTYFALRWLAMSLAGLCLVGWLWRSRTTVPGIAVVLFGTVLTIYWSTHLRGLDNRSDNELYVPSALSLLADADLELSEYGSTNLVTTKPYRIFRNQDGVYNRYPFGTSVFGAPLIGLAYHLAGDEPNTLWRRLDTASAVAAVFGAASATLLFLILCELGCGRPTSVALALLFAFATPQWPTHGGGLWSSNLSVLLLLSAAYCLIFRNGRYAWLSALPLAMAAGTRPTAILFSPIVGLYLLRWRRRQLLAWGSLFTVGVAGLLTASYLIYGSTTPPYYGRHLGMLSSQQVLTALAGLLASPNRGLLVFCPLAILSLLGLIASVRRSPGESTDLFRLFGLFCLGYVLFIATFDVWWGGGSYGPRLLAELFPFLVLLLVPWLETVRQLPARTRTVSWTLLGVFAMFGLFVAYRGVSDPATRAWNRWPKRVSLHHERLWDWRDMQIFRTTTHGPSAR